MNSTFQVINETSQRRDLESRRELKFGLSGSDLGKIRSLLEKTTDRQIHNERVSIVRSIYFDDAKLSACQANLDGLGQRRKLRLRWYDRLLPDKDCYLEIKWRESRVTGKVRLRIKSDRPIHELRYSELREEMFRSIPSQYISMVMRYPDPIVIVEYRREHFVSQNKTIRATIDYDLAFYDQTGKDRVHAQFRQRMPDFMVLEAKAPLGFESQIRSLISPVPLRASRCSKYVHGCRMLGLISAND